MGSIFFSRFVIFCIEVKWFAHQGLKKFFSLGSQTFGSFQPVSPQKKRQILAEQSISLRHFLTDAPFWTGGHLRLGFVELGRAELLDRYDAALLSTVRLSAQAVFALDASLPEQPSRARLEATFLLASAALRERCVGEAADYFDVILDPRFSIQLSERIYSQALEGRAACALILKDEAQAKEYLKKIPLGLRSSEVKLMLNNLQVDKFDS